MGKHKSTLIAGSFALALLLTLSLAATTRAQAPQQIDVLTVNGTIDSWVDRYISNEIDHAQSVGAGAVVIVLNTPGGTLGAMQDITTRMLNARVPTIVFVYPAGAWAGSAGTFITLAANIAAMAPDTTIGAAHPVDATGQNIPSDEQTKITNFSISIIQNIAQERGRNAEWATEAVSSSVSATAQQALDLHVIDLMATDLNDLLNKVDGRTVTTTAGEITLHTQQAPVVTRNMNVAQQFFHTLVDPNVALILLLVGMFGLALELFNPGAIVPAVTGGICLVLAFITFGSLPVNWGGVILVILSVVLFIIDVKVNSLILTAGGVALFVVGALLLFSASNPSLPEFPAVTVSPVLIVALAVIMVAFFLFALGAAVRARNYPVLMGKGQLVGATGIATSDLGPEGVAQIGGQLWTAIAQGEPIVKGDAVRVVEVQGLRLYVVRANQGNVIKS